MPGEAFDDRLCAAEALPAQGIHSVFTRVMSETIRAAMREIDQTLPIQEFTSQISQWFAQERLFARAYAAFRTLAVLMACLGLFGLMSYNVARRTSEVRVRLALGAQRRTVIAMVMSESTRLVAIGVVSACLPAIP